MELVSIIVPVYNAEKYLDDCIQSVLKQTYTLWELLLINDGSTDESANICDKYVEIDKRIVARHEKKSGVSVARNLALDIAKGEYVIFLDADDFWCRNTALEELVSAARKYDLDIVRGEYKRVDISGSDVVCSSTICKNRDYVNKLIDSYHFVEYAIREEFFCWLSLFRTQKIKRYRFESGRVFMEDTIFYAKVCMQPLRCMYLADIIFYAYRVNNSSAANKTNILKLRDSLHNSIVFKDLYELSDNDNLKKFFQRMCLKMYCSTLEWLASDKYYNECIQFILDYRVEEQRVEIVHWAKKNDIRLKLLFFLLPLQVVKIYRFKYILSKWKHLLK